MLRYQDYYIEYTTLVFACCNNARLVTMLETNSVWCVECSDTSSIRCHIYKAREGELATLEEKATSGGIAGPYAR